MSITIHRSGFNKSFNEPSDIKEYVHEILCSVGKIDNDDPAATYDFATVNFGVLRFQPMQVYNMELSRVSGWEFVAMAGLTAIYCRRKEDAQ